MFNNYIAKKRELKLSRRMEEAKQETEWKAKYHAEVQPELLDNYQQRVSSFMHQMHETPIFIGQHPSPERDSDRRTRFVYKNCQDWTSYRTISERLNLQPETKISKKYSASARQAEYSPKQANYRIRNKSKEINLPMRFGKLKTEPLLYEQRRHQSLQQPRRSVNQQLQSALNENEISHRELTSKESDANSDFFDSKGRIQDNEIERTEEQTRIHLRQTKSHFKKLMTLSLIGDQKYKKEIMTILNKCGYIKKKEKNNTQGLQIDHLVRIVQKSREK